MVCLRTRTTVAGWSARAVDIRTAWPARHPSPKNVPRPRMPMTASWPRADTTVSFTFPLWR
jgi:hypothetical protein